MPQDLEGGGETEVMVSPHGLIGGRFCQGFHTFPYESPTPGLQAPETTGGGALLIFITHLKL